MGPVGILVENNEDGGHVGELAGRAGPSSSSSWEEDSFEMRVLLESSSKTMETEGMSVNQPEVGPVPPGGDCVLSIERRLLAKYSFPSSEVIRMARIQAEDLFEVKVEIIKLMAGLDPMGDWMGRGAQTLENSHTTTGEEYLERLYALLEDLQRGGVQSSTYLK
ncbi:hypothetical protein CKAN_02727700 [Cinnamomum micranthum f. kanehirae]|uniref:DUF8018 domain-containing protein n=1 Tax=Cinnamomum micranthum f. kanehirae TaxID=337451 RepID=A0A3S3RAE4_9MAGN|nr:hypothetical protein CKAN_02727700 [Cinnamomum micranthum f. kanehirae]